MKARIKMNNTVKNQDKARQIRDSNREASNVVDITFNKDLTEIYFEGEIICIPQKEWFTEDMLVHGQTRIRGVGLEVTPVEKGKTVNLRLDADLVAELNEVRNHVLSKTQHDIVLELFKKGLDQYNRENT